MVANPVPIGGGGGGAGGAGGGGGGGKDVEVCSMGGGGGGSGGDTHSTGDSLADGSMSNAFIPFDPERGSDLN